MYSSLDRPCNLDLHPQERSNLLSCKERFAVNDADLDEILVNAEDISESGWLTWHTTLLMMAFKVKSGNKNDLRSAVIKIEAEAAKLTKKYKFHPMIVDQIDAAKLLKAKANA
jgi:hypothetical protein